MARGKVQMKRIENPVHRQVTFCKRRSGLLKKAKELSVLCDAEIGVFIFSSHGKFYDLATNGSMQGLIEKYMKVTGGSLQPDEQAKESTQPLVRVINICDAKEEINMLKKEIEILQKGLRYLVGGGAAHAQMTMDELLILEKNLEIWICHIRSTKMEIMSKEIQLLRNKEGVLKAANQYLQDKIEETVEITNFEPMTPYPLTIQNDIFQF
ncbi:agamous-like MADS-box protein AGL12 isoform X2 [Hevea brasiliensis]|uniref:agamous-like MADS-box protein AGL12 isoform X2 n=1 Tax=Hevea brasiliensis TaxID=3981 RepID=UPI0025D70B2C|nr:agamous-like MADS-box protein AGL12 isoform X2 [Hevea brasiliensis]